MRNIHMNLHGYTVSHQDGSNDLLYKRMIKARGNRMWNGSGNIGMKCRWCIDDGGGYPWVWRCTWYEASLITHYKTEME